MKQQYRQQPVRPNGGHRRSAEVVVSSGLIRTWFIRFCGALVLVTVSGLMLKGVMLMTAKPVAEVQIKGDFSHLTRDDISSRIYTAMEDSFIKMDLHKLQERLESEPWIDQANVSRQWPDTLVVRIQEQQPIARWGQDGFLNQRGQIIRPATLGNMDHLPLLSGPDQYSVDLMQRYQVLSKLLRKNDLRVAEIQVDEGLAWKIVLADGLEILIGRDRVMEKIERFLLVYQAQLKNRFDGVAKIDVRYSNGVAVSWKDTATETMTKLTKKTARIAG